MNLRLHLTRHPRPTFDRRIQRNIYHRPGLIERWNGWGLRGFLIALLGTVLAVSLAWCRELTRERCHAPAPGWELVTTETDIDRGPPVACRYVPSRKVRA